VRSIAVAVATLALVQAPHAAADTPPDVRRVSNVVTVQTSAAHNFQPGDTVTIAGVVNPPDPCGDPVAGTSFNGTVAVASAPSTTSFTYAQSGPDGIGQGGTATGPVITRSITTASRSSNAVTINTSSAHGFFPGQTVTIAGVSVSSFNGAFTISSTPTSTTLVYGQTGPSDSGTGGTATVQGFTKSIGSGDTTGPAAPGALSATSVDSTVGGIAYDSDGSFGVEWGASSDGGSGVGIYCAQRSTSASGPFELLAFVTHPATSVAQSGLAEGSYFYRVRTRDNVGNLSSFTGPFQVVVDFPGPQTVSASRTGDGSGTVTSSPAGIECGAACSAAFDYGTVVRLTATAAGGSSFTGWSGACTGTGTCEVTMTEARDVRAAFAVVPSGNPLTPDPPPGTTPLPDTVAPRVTLPRRRLRATRRGYIRLPIVCPSTEPEPCKGAVKLRHPRSAASAALTRTVARASFTISPGATRRVRMRLTRFARRAIARNGRIRVSAIVVVTDEAGNTRRIRVPLKILRAT
jgi:hypothetical protein